MSWSFKPGDRVVCIKQRSAASIEQFAHMGGNWPVKGGVYTIATINVWPAPRGALLTFLELNNSHLVPRFSKIEPGFGAEHFRPVRTTSIESLLAYLNTIPVNRSVDA